MEKKTYEKPRIEVLEFISEGVMAGTIVPIPPITEIPGEEQEPEFNPRAPRRNPRDFWTGR
ncbi:MAG: hypothetical protein ACI36X_07805 [Bacteroidaceae bacterium]